MFLNLNKKPCFSTASTFSHTHPTQRWTTLAAIAVSLLPPPMLIYDFLFLFLSFDCSLTLARSLVALGCEPPSPIPPHMTLVRRSERRVRYVCDPLYVFPDTAEPSRELVCTARHTWNRPLPACVGEYPNALLASFFCLLFNAWPACVIAWDLGIGSWLDLIRVQESKSQ